MTLATNCKLPSIVADCKLSFPHRWFELSLSRVGPPFSRLVLLEPLRVLVVGGVARGRHKDEVAVEGGGAELGIGGRGLRGRRK